MDDTLEQALRNAIDNGTDLDLFNMDFDDQPIEDIECKILVDYALKKGPENWNQWVKDKNTNLKLLVYLLDIQRFDKLYPIHIKYFDNFTQKDASHLTVLTLFFLCKHISPEHYPLIKHWFAIDNLTDLMWKLFRNQNRWYQLISADYSFDVNKREYRKKSLLSIEIPSEFKNNNTLEDTVNLMKTVREGFENNAIWLLDVVMHGYINEFIDEFRNEILSLFMKHSSMIYRLIDAHNFKILDLYLANTNVDVFNYEILSYGAKSHIEYYFPDLTQQKVDDIFIKYTSKQCH